MPKYVALACLEVKADTTILLPNWKWDRRVTVQFGDITMLSAELGFPHLASRHHHPSESEFSDDKPYKGQTFDLVFCDGNVLSTNPRTAGSVNEAPRLTAAQLVIALQRIKPGGTLVVLLHQANNPRVVRLLEAFSQFSEITLFKPTVSHVKRSSFCFVAKDVDPRNARACRFVNEVKSAWGAYTAQNIGLVFPKDSIEEWQRRDAMEDILKSFGGRFIALAVPVWEIQKEALKKQFLSGEK